MTIKSTPSRGVLLVALGAPEYGNMAANLAASIRYSDPGIGIHLVHTESSVAHMGAEHSALFTSMALCPEQYYTASKPANEVAAQSRVTDTMVVSPSFLVPHPSPAKIEYLKAKTQIYDLTPFDETIFLDVDMLMLPGASLSQTLAQLSACCDYTIENRGYADLSLPEDQLNPTYSTWCNILDVKKHYQTTGRFYHLHSEFIFFKKNERNQKFFATVREVYDTRPIAWQVFDGGVPDEYAFDIATCITGHYPHSENYIAIYWHGMDGTKTWNKEVIGHYIGFSLGGNTIPQWILQKVDAYRQLYRQALRLPYLFKVGSKKSWNKQRMKI